MNHFLSFQMHGNADAQGGLVAYLDALLGFLTGLLNKSPNEIFSSLFPGVAALENIHPLLVHFPIAFLSIFFLVDMTGIFLKKAHWREFATGLLYIGTISAFFTVIAGFIAADKVAHGHDVHAIMEQHELFGVIILSLAGLLSLWRWKLSASLKGELGIVHNVMTALLMLFVILGADLGGLMVYHYGVAVKAVPESVTQSYQHHAHGQ